MLRIGLTGGIGSGKSTVAARLAELGAVVIDSDRLAREVVQPGTRGLAAVVQRFGSDILGPDGALDRVRLGRMVFEDPVALADLNAIVHPLVRARSTELAAAAASHAVLVQDIPLLVENGMQDEFNEVLVVQAPTAQRLDRLERRGLSRDDALMRIQHQASDEQRAAVATRLLDNSGTPAELVEQVDALWHELATAG